MLEALLKVYYEAYLKYQSLVLGLTHDKYEDWALIIKHEDSNTVIFDSDGAYLTDLAARGYAALRQWLDEKTGDGGDFVARANIF